MHCAAPGFDLPAAGPDLGPDAITLQPIRAGFPCFGAALAGYVEATREDDAEKNRLCPPSPYGDTLAEWAQMNVRGTRAAMSFGSEPDIKEWANRVAAQPGPDPARAPRIPGAGRCPCPTADLSATPGWRKLVELSS